MGQPLTALPSGRPTGGTPRGRRSTGSPIECDEQFRPYRRLAVRVLTRAVLDVMDTGESSTHRKSARAFLAGSPMLQHWCHVAALDPDRMVDYVTRVLARPPLAPDNGQATGVLREAV